MSQLTVNNYLLKKIRSSSLLIILTLLITSILCVLITSFLIGLLPNIQPFNRAQQFSKGAGWGEKFAIAILVAPLIETFLFQYLIIEGIVAIFKIKHFSFAPIFISSILFGLSHCYNLMLFVQPSMNGSNIATCYCNFIPRKKTGFKSTVFLHSLFNLIVFITDYLS